MRRFWGVLVVCATLCALAGDAFAASGPVYREPANYVGIRKAPPTKAAPAPKPPAPFALSQAGSFPDELVDDAGTAHVVWNENRGDAADVVVYCRIKRGATGCDTRTELAWAKTFDVGDGPQYDVGGPPQVVQIGGQLVVFSHRYPTIAEKPDGASSSTVIAWASGDGGTTWAPQPAIIGKWNVGDMVVLGPADDPTILNLGVDPLCGADGAASLCLEAFKSGQYTPTATNLATVKDENYYENLVLDEKGAPVIAAEDLAYNTYVRRWTGAAPASPADPAAWTAPTVIPRDQVSLAGGPAGVYLMGTPKAGGAYSVARLNQQGAGGYAVGSAVDVTPATDAVLGELGQDSGGHLLAAWEQRGKGLQLRTTAAAAGGKPAFAAERQVTDGEGNGQFALGGATDGGGFLAYNHTGGINGEGQIAVAGFGEQTANGKPGIADVRGGGIVAGGSGTNGSCRELNFGSFTADSAAGCILKGTGSFSQDYVTAGEINLWGLRIVPDAGVKIVINPNKLEINTTGQVRVIVTAPAPVGDVVLFHGEIHRDLSKVVPGTNLFEFPTGLFKPSILGFGVAADIAVRLEKDGVHIPLDLKLPPALGNFSAHAEFVADRDSGLHINSVHLHLGPIPLGALVINSIDLDYQGAGDIWTGAGSITVPAGGTLDVSATFAMGDFKSASFSFKPGTPIPIGPFVYLIRFGGGFGIDPVVIDANATVGGGAAVNGRSPVEVDGDFKMTFPKQGPADFKMKGTVTLFLIQIADGSLDFQTDGYAAFRGHAGAKIGPLKVDANIDGFVDAPTGQYGASFAGSVDLCVDVDPIGEFCAGATAGAAVSSRGFAACARFNPPDPIGGFEAGIAYPWSDFNPDFLVNPFLFGVSLLSHVSTSCHVDAYRIPPPRAAQAGASTVEVPAGLPTETILVESDTGQPRVSVTGPGGVTVASGTPGPAGFVMTAQGLNGAYVHLRKPAAGTWTVTALPGSPAITRVLAADGYAAAKVKATLGGHARARTIGYRISGAGHGQSVSFQETGAFGTHVLGTAKGTSGTLRFAPADTRGGKRTVFALIDRDGLVTDRIKVGTYVAPGPVKPGVVRSLRAKRSGTTLTLRWGPASGAQRYVVTLRGAHGTRLGRLVPGKTRKLRFTAVRRDERVVAQVRGLSKKLRLGAARSITVRGRR